MHGMMQALSMSENVQREFSCDNIIPTMTVKKGGTLIDDLSQLSAGDTLNVTVSDLDDSSIETRKVIIAQYDSTGALLVTAKNDLPATATGKAFSITAGTKVLEDTAEIKVFYWDIDNLVPFMGVYVID